MDTVFINSLSPPLEERNSGKNAALFTQQKVLVERLDVAMAKEEKEERR